MKRSIFLGLIGIIVIGTAITVDYFRHPGESEPETPRLLDGNRTGAPAVAPAGQGNALPEQAGATPASEPDSQPGATPSEAARTPNPPGEELVPGDSAGLVSPDTVLENPATRPDPSVNAADPATPDPGQIGEAPVPPVRKAPEFGVVRVNPRGEAVIAGRAGAGATVTVRDNGKALGQAGVDDNGEWVFVPPAPLEPGQHKLDLVETGPAGQEGHSEKEILVVIAEPGEGLDGVPSDKPVKPLALLADREGDGPATVLQAPEVPAQDNSGTEAAVQSEDPAAGAGETAPEAGPASGTEGPVNADPEAGKIVLIRNVDIAPDGSVHVTGLAPQGSAIRLYIDDVPAVDDAFADETGMFRFSPDQPLQEGSHRARVDMLAPTGNVLARAEAAFDVILGKPELDDSWNGEIVIRRGQNLWSIARQTYGQGRHFTMIYNANRAQIRDPNLIYPGQVFNLPRPDGPASGEQDVGPGAGDRNMDRN